MPFRGIAADEIVASCGQLIIAGYPRYRIRANQLDPKDGRFARLADPRASAAGFLSRGLTKCEYSFSGREEQAIAGAARNEVDVFFVRHMDMPAQDVKS